MIPIYLICLWFSYLKAYLKCELQFWYTISAIIANTDNDNNMYILIIIIFENQQMHKAM